MICLTPSLKSLKRGLPVLIVVVCVALAAQYFESRTPSVIASGSDPVEISASESDRAIAEAFRTRRSNVQIEGTGTVTRVLPADNDGNPHQRFILELASGQTLLIAHNIELAPPIDGLRRGDVVRFFGEYEWNERGGLIHWTHHDPAGRHIGGWLEHDGLRYE